MKETPTQFAIGQNRLIMLLFYHSDVDGELPETPFLLILQ